MPVGVKWRGKSVYQVLSKLEESRRTGAAAATVAQALRAQERALELEAAQALVKVLDGYHGLKPEYIGFARHWDCPESPTDHCVYNREKDPAQDDCLFCHQPYERK